MPERRQWKLLLLQVAAQQLGLTRAATRSYAAIGLAPLDLLAHDPASLR